MKPGKGPPKKEDIDPDKQAAAVQHLFEETNMHAERKYEQNMIAGDDDNAVEHMEEVCDPLMQHALHFPPLTYPLSFAMPFL